jgi:hypothetical protein
MTVTVKLLCAIGARRQSSRKLTATVSADLTGGKLDRQQLLSRLGAISGPHAFLPAGGIETSRSWRLSDSRYRPLIGPPCSSTLPPHANIIAYPSHVAR